MNEVVIVSYARTPMGAFNGGLSTCSSIDLGAIAIKGAIDKIQLDVQVVEEVFMGCVIQANLGQAPARQAALKAGLPQHVNCTAINKVCASSMKALAMGVAAIQTSDIDCAVVGGMECMSQSPYSQYAQGAAIWECHHDRWLCKGWVTRCL